WDKQPGITNLLQIYMSLSDETKEQTLDKWQDKNNYGDFKRELASIVEAFLTKFQQERNKIDESTLIHKLKISESKMQEQANAKLLSVQKAVGLR
ncbi:MAG: tryptophanyl-tRNA synthetase, partial [Patescibacteria group bacterium]|nr:tryptophanyl-tRNA synthetase [Patescibacteria group bacterium]